MKMRIIEGTVEELKEYMNKKEIVKYTPVVTTHISTKKPRWTKKEKKKVIELANSGLSVIEIANQMGRTIKAVEKQLRKTIKRVKERRHKKWTQGEIAMLYKLQLEGKSVKEIAKILTRSKTAIRIKQYQIKTGRIKVNTNG